MPDGLGAWQRSLYHHELRHRALHHRRAFHRHDVGHFVRLYDVATHEHCESTMGSPACGHDHGDPVMDAIDGSERLYGLWLTDQRPDRTLLRRLG